MKENQWLKNSSFKLTNVENRDSNGQLRNRATHINQLNSLEHIPDIRKLHITGT